MFSRCACCCGQDAASDEEAELVDRPDAVYDKVGNVLLSRLTGADVRLVDSEFGIGFKESWQRAVAEIEVRGGKPCAIPAGASDHRLGGLGFASWAVEVAEQERQLGAFFDAIVVCSVTGSTQAGMVAGFAALPEARQCPGRPTRAQRGTARCSAERRR